MFLLISASFISQRQRLREFLIRQQMQRKEAAAAAAAAGGASPGWSGGEINAFQQDKAHRAPPPYPQVNTEQCATFL